MPIRRGQAACGKARKTSGEGSQQLLAL